MDNAAGGDAQTSRYVSLHLSTAVLIWSGTHSPLITLWIVCTLENTIKPGVQLLLATLLEGLLLVLFQSPPCDKLLPWFLIPAGSPCISQSFESCPAPVQVLSLNKCLSTFKRFCVIWPVPQERSPGARSGFFSVTPIYLRARNSGRLCV